MSEPSQKIQPNELDPREAIDFLKKLDPHGRHNLVAIDPKDGSISGQTFEPGQFSEMERWVEAHNGRANCYFSVNEPRAGAPHSKVRKGDIVAARALHVDIDPRGGADPIAERSRLQDLLSRATVRPTFAVDSGGGVQAFWKFAEKLSLKDGPATVEQMNRAAAALFGEGDATQNIERIMRLPGTINIPNASKREKGRTERRASTLWLDGPTYDHADLASALPAVAARPSAANDDTDPRIQRCIAEISASDYQTVVFNDLPSELRSRFDGFLNRAGLREFWETHDDPGSEKRFELARHLKRDGAFSAVDYARLAWIWPRSTSRPDIDSALSPRALARDWVRCWTSAGEEFEPVEGIDDDEPSGPVTVASTVNEAVKTSRFRLETLGDLARLPKPKWLVDGWVPENATGILYGKWGSGKSFVAFDLGLHIAHGLPNWHGADVTNTGRKVLIIAREGHQGFVDRAEAFRRHHNIPLVTENFVFLRTPVNFMLDGDFNALEHFITSLGDKFALVIIDTVARVMAGADMSAPESVTAFMERCDRLAKAAGGTVIGVHHENKSGTMMGSTFFEANADFVYGLTRDSGENAPLSDGTIRCTKMKDGPDGWSRSVKFVGVDWEAEGEPRGSLAVEAIQRPPRRGVVPVSKAASILLECLESAMEAAGGTPVSFAAWVHTRYRHALPGWQLGDPTPDDCGDSTLRKRRSELIDAGIVYAHGKDGFATFPAAA